MTTFAIRAIAARATAPFVSTEEARYYLTGINIEPTAGGGAIAVATDGHTLGAYRDPVGYADGRCIVRLADLMTALKAKPPWHHAIWLVGIDGKIAVVEAPGDGEVVGHAVVEAHRAGELRILATGGADTMIDGAYPDWRRIVPDTSVIEMLPGGISYASSYLKRFSELGKLFQIGRSGSVMTITPTGAVSPSVVSYSTDRNFFGVLMPMREQAWSRPAWLAHAPTSAELLSRP